LRSVDEQAALIAEIRAAVPELVINARVDVFLRGVGGVVDGPINVLLTPNGPSATELEELGVARATWGSGLAALAYSEAVRVAAAALSRSRG
jgi:2-methylisocitrate lyase-like PEP mutase family enzyme